jgi:hypothetical protein
VTGILCALPIIGAPTASPPADPLAVSLNRSSVSGSATTSTITTNSVSATGSGGTSPYTYAWSRVSGNSAITATNANSRSTSFTRSSCVAGTSYSATWRCQVTDSAGTIVYSSNVSVTITCTGGSSSGGTFNGIADTRIINETDTPTATATFSINSDGTYSGGGTWNGSSSVGSSYEVKATATSGTLTSGTTGSWLSLSSNRSWSKTDTTQNNVAVTVTFRLDIRAAGTTTVLDSASITLTANVPES